MTKSKGASKQTNPREADVDDNKSHTGKSESEVTDKKESPEQGSGLKKRNSRGKNNRNSADGKRFKITTRVGQANHRAWQIRGFKIQNGMNGCYFKKSLSTGLDEEPYLKEFYSKVERYEELREEDLGIAYTGVRADSDGNLIPASQNHPGSEWTIFISFEKDVGTIQDWLDVVCKRMNKDDIAANKDLFKWKVAFTVTGWGDETKHPKLHEVMAIENVVELVVGLHQIENSSNLNKDMDKLDLSKYFSSHKDGKSAIEDYFAGLNM